ncbi:enoyl-CoA hydratase/isomerase family protein [Halorarum halobium]|uniref:enoyl-CoA hydratase/isomerase family protein n=1 Tax=Halorarum halobium TaxID=3075121 RepID=UPI0028A6A4D7|nr:enoyl-CoA hydratase-related protein [Halobaculum sp. XH14]
MTTPAEAAAEGNEFVAAEVGGRGEHVATVTIDRPDARNALNATVRSELKSVFAAIAEDDSVRVVVLTGGEDSGAFVAGADVTELHERSAVEQREASSFPRVYEVVAECPKPVVARVNGHALGGGCELAQACDVRIAAEGAKLGQPEIGLGLIPGGGGTQRLPRLVGEGQALKLILSGELVEATEAAELGLVEEAVPEGELDGRVDDLAGAIAEKSPLAVRRAKQAVRGGADRSLRQGLAYERELFVGLFDSHDKNEGIGAFLEDREPDWRGE